MWYQIFKDKTDEVFERYKQKNAVTYMLDNGDTVDFDFGKIHNVFIEFSNIMKKYGIAQGDRIAILTPHSPYGVITGYAAVYNNVTIVLVDAAISSDEIRRLIKLADVKAIFTTQLLSSIFIDNIWEYIPIINIEKTDFSYPLIQGTVSVERKINDEDKEVIAVLFSSGTTSDMKGIMVTYKSVCMARDIFTDFSGLNSDMSYLIVLPFNHISGFTGVFTFLLTGCTLGFIENVNASKLSYGLKKFEPSYFAMVPRVFEVIEEQIRKNVCEKGRLKYGLFCVLLNMSGILRRSFGFKIGRKIFNNVIEAAFGKNIYGIGTGAAPCNEKTVRFFLNMGLEWSNLYATTESGVPIAATGIHDKYPIGSVGRVNKDNDIAVCINNADENGIGEIYVKSPLVMKGYFRDNELTKDSFDNGYFKTGDLGYIDKKGYLHLRGRVKENIVLKTGKKITLSQVEDYYTSKMKDLTIVCRGVHKQEGWDCIYIYVLKKNYSKEYIDYIKNTIFSVSAQAPSMYKIEKLYFVDEIPYTSVGKIRRYLLDKKETTDGGNTRNINENNVVLKIFDKYCKNYSVTYQSNIKEELGVDSLTLYEIVSELENLTNKNIMEYLDSVTYVWDIVDIIQGKQGFSNKSGADRYLIERSDHEIRICQKLFFKINMFCKIDYSGLENIIDAPCIIASNHTSHLDIFCIYQAIALAKGKKSILGTNCLAAQELLEDKSVEKIFKSLGAIPVNRTGNPANVLETVKTILEQNRYVVIFPEGTRSRNGKLGKFTSGTAASAIATGVPVIPVGISGAYDILPADKKRISFHFRRQHIQVAIGKPVYHKDINDIEKLNDIIKRSIIQLCEGGKSE